MDNKKKVIRIDGTRDSHWVGDGFPVRTLFSYSSHGADVSPFLLFDYAGPMKFDPSKKPRGVEEHPHRGFETVTIVFSGGLEHRDSAGHAGKIGPGDVQWMTAASGVVHEEMHSREFTESGGTFEVVQLWVNLPAAEKMSIPRYQELTKALIPELDLPGGIGSVRVIAGALGEVTGPAKTTTPLELFALQLHAGAQVKLEVPPGHTATLAVLDSAIEIDGTEVGGAQVAVFGTEGTTVEFTVLKAGKVLVLAGEPIDEPISGYGPFVMNTKDEIQQALADYRSGKMGRLPASV